MDIDKSYCDNNKLKNDDVFIIVSSTYVMSPAIKLKSNIYPLNEMLCCTQQVDSFGIARTLFKCPFLFVCLLFQTYSKRSIESHGYGSLYLRMVDTRVCVCVYINKIYERSLYDCCRLENCHEKSISNGKLKIVNQLLSASRVLISFIS